MQELQSLHLECCLKDQLKYEIMRVLHDNVFGSRLKRHLMYHQNALIFVLTSQVCPEISSGCLIVSVLVVFNQISDKCDTFVDSLL